MNERQNLSITLRFETSNRGEAGWVLTVPDPKVENQGWAVKPTHVPASVAIAVARTIDTELGLRGAGDMHGPMETQVLAQHSRVADDLRATIARKKATLESIERDETTLAALVETFDIEGS